jgi:hypothetical protein
MASKLKDMMIMTIFLQIEVLDLADDLKTILISMRIGGNIVLRNRPSKIKVKIKVKI